MNVIHKVTLHLGSKSVVLYVRDDDCRHLFEAAHALAVHCRSVAYARAPTTREAWSSFLEMRLALHEHRAAPAVGTCPATAR